jgi:mono/diheme cytochrome c family protein
MTLMLQQRQIRLLWLSVFLCLLHTPALTADAKRGEYLTHAGGCSACHTQENGQDMAGGRPLESPFGTFYSPNITPDETAGIGGWSDAEFITAFQEGINPAGEHYYPAFPYPSYTGLSDTDLLDIKAYLDSLPASSQANREHDLVWYAQWRAPLYFWKWLYFTSARFVPDAEKAPTWNRGAYLVRHLGHCGECHTPRTILGGSRKQLELAGAPGFGDAKAAPNLTPHADGLENWRSSDLELFLEIGMLPNGDFAGGEMSVVIDENTALLTSEDRTAIVQYLRELPPLPNEY